VADHLLLDGRLGCELLGGALTEHHADDRHRQLYVVVPQPLGRLTAQAELELAAARERFDVELLVVVARRFGSGEALEDLLLRFFERVEASNQRVAHDELS
jgi:hypothetical protein